MRVKTEISRGRYRKWMVVEIELLRIEMSILSNIYYII